MVCVALGIDRCSGPHYLLGRCVEVIYGRRVSLSKLEIDRVIANVQVIASRLNRGSSEQVTLPSSSQVVAGSFT